MKKLLFTIAIASVMASCSKDPGVGGSATISGTLKVSEVLNGVPQPAVDADQEDVYLIYGSDTTKVYDDNFETSWNGKFNFDHLKKGTYTLFVYSETNYMNYDGADYPVFTTIEIDKNGQAIELDDITIYK